MREIQLSKGFMAVVDDADFEILSRSKWHTKFNRCRTPYASGWDGKKKVLMHRAIMAAKVGEIVDHINGNTLDNRRENLRVVSASINMLNAKMYSNNKSGWRGVQRCKKSKKWKAVFSFKKMG